MNIFDEYCRKDVELITKLLPARHGKPWPQSEDEQLLRELRTAWPIEDIMKRHERSRSGILYRIIKNEWQTNAKHISEFGEQMIDKQILANAFEAGEWLGPVFDRNKWSREEAFKCLEEMYGPYWTTLRDKPTNPKILATFHGTPWIPAKPQGRATTLLLLLT